MPVSHLGLSVSHIPSATSFYLAALQPLGYRYIGQQGASIGLGIEDADFFLCQEPNGARVAPTHIAFTADERTTVRDCYTAALNAGGVPSGSPTYRNNDCSCFNAAVCDPDGNTIEFIFRQSQDASNDDNAAALSEAGTRITSWQQDGSESAIDDGESVSSKVSKAKSRTQTALDLASTTSRSMKKSGSGTVTPKDGSGKTIMGTFLGAAAGAAFAYAMCKSEQDNAKDEAAFQKAMSLKERASGRVSERGSQRGTGSVRRSSSAAARTITERTRTTQSGNNPPKTMKMIEMEGYDDAEVQAAIKSFSQQRARPTMPARSQTYDNMEYSPALANDQNSRFGGPSRSQTMPDDIPHYYIDGPKSSASRRSGRAPSSEYAASCPTSRRGSDDGGPLKRHDSAMSVQSHRTARTDRKSDESPRSVAASEASRRTSATQQAGAASSRAASQAGSQASTIKPSQSNCQSRYMSAAGVPLPASMAGSAIYSEGPTPRSYAPSAAQMPPAASKAPSYVPAKDMPSVVGSQTPSRSAPVTRAPSQNGSPSYFSAKDGPMPPSKAPSYVSARDMPPPQSNFGGSGYTRDPEEDDGMDDLETVVPDDSISCVDFNKPARSTASKRSHRSQRGEKSSKKESDMASRSGMSKHTSSSRQDRDNDKRSEATTVRTTKDKRPAVAMTDRTKSETVYSKRSGGQRGGAK